MLTPDQWHAHFSYQANWTEQVRQHFFYDRSGENPKILEIGCGTGAIIGSTFLTTRGKFFGLDYSFEFLEFCSKQNKQIQLACGNAIQLPFCDGAFEITFCHFLLLWLNEPLSAMKEMTRVTRKGGWVAAFAEPDHEARIDYPKSFEKAGKAQAMSLKQQGANLQSGRQLGALLLGCGLRNVEVGILGANWRIDQRNENAEEGIMLRHDLDWLSDEKNMDNTIGLYTKEEMRQSVVFVPTFYAWGQV